MIRAIRSADSVFFDVRSFNEKNPGIASYSANCMALKPITHFSKARLSLSASLSNKIS